MASYTSAVSVMAMPLARAELGAGAFLKPLPLRPFKGAAAAVSKSAGKFEVSASLKEKAAVAGFTAAALTASMVAPDVAEAAVSPSLKNFLLSIGAGGVVLVAILGAVIGVANFDPVKRV